MRFAYFGLCLLSVFALLMSSAWAVETPLTFKWLPSTVVLDNKYYSTAEACDAITVNDVTVRRGYRDKNLYFYFTISDVTDDAADGFSLRFDTNGDGSPSDSEPNAQIYRNGAVQATAGIQVFVDHAPGRTWKGKILVPFSLVGIPVKLQPQGLPTSGPAIWFKGYDASSGSLGAYPEAEAVGPTKSDYHWAQPMNLKVLAFPESNPDQTWVRETDNPKVPVLEFILETNNEEEITANTFTISSTGAGLENEQIAAVEAHLFHADKDFLLGSQPFAQDNSQITFPLNQFTLGWGAQAENAPYVVVYYVLNEKAGYVHTNNGLVLGTYTVTLASIDETGDYTGEKLNAPPLLPYTGGTLSTTDCKTNNGCADAEFCAFSSCRDVVATSDCGYAANHQWNNYECCADAICGAGKKCTDHVCVAAAEPAPTCSGSVDLSLSQMGANLKAAITGPTNCANKQIYIKSDSCTGTTKCSFIWSAEPASNSCQFLMPVGAGTYTYYACMDMNSDTQYGTGEKDMSTVVVTAQGNAELPAVPPEQPPSQGTGTQPSGTPTCVSEGCTVSNWASCVCATGSTSGTQTGRCQDNCGEIIYKQQACTCASASTPSGRQPSGSGTSPFGSVFGTPSTSGSDTEPVVNFPQPTGAKPEFDMSAWALIVLIALIMIVAGYIASKKIELKKR
jgi:hypothetical protein